MPLDQEIKSKIQQLWGRFWAGGIANPLSAIEQISYLIFLRLLEDEDNREIQSGRRQTSRYEGHENCKWSYIKEIGSSEEMLRVVRDEAFPFMKSLPTNGDTFPAAMKDAVFIIPKPSLLQSAVDIIDELNITGQKVDTQGDIYEELLSELSLAGKNGQFRTPRHIIRTIVQLVNPEAGEYVCDPAAGTAGFLVAAYQWMKYQNTPSDIREIDADGEWHNLHPIWKGKTQAGSNHFVGYDFDTTMVRLGLMNMLLHGIEHPQFRYQDTLSKSFSCKQLFNVILANPPFTGSIDKHDVNPDLKLDTKKTELLFVELCLNMLDTGGRCAIIVPEGVLFGSTKAHKELRKKLIEENQIEAVISLPAGCFKPYTGVKTSILYFTKGGSTDKVWFYEVTGDGYTLDDKRNPASVNNDLKYVPEAYQCFAMDEPIKWDTDEDKYIAEARQWWAECEEIEKHGYNLTAGAYAPILHEETVHDNPIDILRRVRDLELDISERLNHIETAIAEAVSE